jgi:hypothetical protein
VSGERAIEAKAFGIHGINSSAVSMVTEGLRTEAGRPFPA